jgi:hypothetical protein
MFNTNIYIKIYITIFFDKIFLNIIFSKKKQITMKMGKVAKAIKESIGKKSEGVYVFIFKYVFKLISIIIKIVYYASKIKNK